MGFSFLQARTAKLSSTTTEPTTRGCVRADFDGASVTFQKALVYFAKVESEDGMLRSLFLFSTIAMERGVVLLRSGPWALACLVY